MSIGWNRTRHGFLLIAAILVCFWIVKPVTAKETYMVIMRDGIGLATDVYFPEGEGPWPAVLARTPYGRFGIDELTRRGYVVVAQD